MLVHALQAFEPAYQSQGRLFPHARHAGDVVGGVAHQAFHVDELARRDAVFFLHGGLVHLYGDAFAQRGAGQQHPGVRAHKLQAVAVACGDDALVAARFACGGKRAQNIVCFKALARHHAVAKARQKLLQNGKLAGQLLRHALALGLVAVVHFVAEGGGL